MKKFLVIFLVLSIVYSQKPNTFQTLMLNNLLSNSEKNVCISPLSIYQIVSLLSNGATGKTKNEILKALIPDSAITKKTQLELNLNNQKILRYYNSNNEKVKMANAILAKHPLLESFAKIAQKYNTYNGLLKSVEQVNNWVNEKTNGKIKTILDQNKNLANVEMILLNAIYFKSKWKYEFNKKDTVKKEFKNSNKVIVNVDTMYKEFETIKYYEDEKIQMVELPYEDENLSMILLLPSEKYTSVKEYINKEKEDYTKLYNKLKEIKDVKLYLPKFEVEFSSSLVDSFKKMGMKLAFSDNANLDQLFSNPNLNKGLYVEDILHKTYVKVDEEGTEAASSTAVIISRKSMKKNIYFNRSFIYMIRDKRIKDTKGNDMMLFLGVINELK
jgi:serpin B